MGGARTAVGERRRRTGRAGKGDMGRWRGFGLRREKRKEKGLGRLRHFGPGEKEKKREGVGWLG